ncbi:MAG TPA: LCP family protein [Firmicutes bacterium]|uniref:LCP family protein n=1 Tax=Capillibacterium thermochitinicola TaxID=2699427 RepID=A0A8J6HY31_9FIRM|nr:LCP family protein [Capillibacterium thermochitinicola]MBA2131985.1 LCP family protein [Capillibacterium thermochitinicola]HHW12579.1 LCP family protein [Bacillota bacterium]
MQLFSDPKARPGLAQKLVVTAVAVIFFGQLTLYLTSRRWLNGTEKFLRTPTNILLLGVDAPNYNEQGELERPRTDTMLFLAVRPEQGRAALFSIPRDSLIEIPGVGMERLNMAHVHGGYELTKSLVEKIMEMPVDRYLMVDFQSFGEIVDLVGGVEVTVDKRMLYEDRSAGFRIDLQPGRQKLTGNQALGFVRFRRDALGDITRTRRQQQFLAALAQKLQEKETFLRLLGRLPDLIRIGRDYVQTDLQFSELLGLYLFFKDLDLGENLQTWTLPGEFSGPYWRLHPREIEHMTQAYR